jgi:hypothetical protein
MILQEIKGEVHTLVCKKPKFVLLTAVLLQAKPFGVRFWGDRNAAIITIVIVPQGTFWLIVGIWNESV